MNEKLNSINPNIPNYISKIIVDGANVAFSSRIGNKADIRNISILFSKLKEFQNNRPTLKYEVICDSSLKYNISNQNKFEKWIRKGKLKVCPSHIEADKYLITLMQKYDGEIILISNDLLRDHPKVQDLECRIQYGYIFAFEDIILHKIEFNCENRSKIMALKGKIEA